MYLTQFYLALLRKQTVRSSIIINFRISQTTYSNWINAYNDNLNPFLHITLLKYVIKLLGKDETYMRKLVSYAPLTEFEFREIVPERKKKGGIENV
jgi:hypothetical protein